MVEYVVCNDEIWVRFPAGPLIHNLQSEINSFEIYNAFEDTLFR